MNMAKLSVGVLASGRGSNFQALIDAQKNGTMNAEIKVLISDSSDAYAIQRARKAGIPVETVERTAFPTREAMDGKILEILQRHGVQLVVLAGYMRIIKSPKLLEAYQYKMINIHPSLLPAFAGTTHAQKDAFEYGAKISGLTIHLVTDDLDHGPILYQEAVDISDCKDAEEVAQRILAREHAALPKVVDSFSKGEYIVNGRRVTYVRSVSLPDRREASTADGAKRTSKARLSERQKTSAADLPKEERGQVRRE